MEQTDFLCAEGLDYGLDFEAALGNSDLVKWKSGPQVGVNPQRNNTKLFFLYPVPYCYSCETVYA